MTDGATTGIAIGRDGSVVFYAEGRTEHVQCHALETPDAAEALEHALKCWLVYGCREVTLKREWRKPDNESISPTRTPND